MKRLLVLFIVLWPYSFGYTGAFVLDRVLAVVNGEVISLSDIEREWYFFAKADTSELNTDRTVSERAMRQAIEDLINHKLLLAEAIRFDIEGPTEKEIQRGLEEVRGRFSSSAAFETALRQTAMTLEDLRQRVIQHLRVKLFIDQRIRFFVFILPDQISRYRSEHPEEFQGMAPDQAEREIEKLLFDRKAEEKLKAYLSNLRAKAVIQSNLE